MDAGTTGRSLIVLAVRRDRGRWPASTSPAWSATQGQFRGTTFLEQLDRPHPRSGIHVDQPNEEPPGNPQSYRCGVAPTTLCGDKPSRTAATKPGWPFTPTVAAMCCGDEPRFERCR
ncbi:hypothetical protein C5E45_21735 [Nocardia nova]|uniref:Uncharacterized protein n=1 Tax=Nocardia nova TaxID=37330 RepID=A0A2S6ALC8_9NOCA|nr:hypothetical protein C5E41_16370 [Nocardia nova]PPJ36041.1 hypothetical protein C5E45_21735 [Nocardia nova]